MGPRPAGCERQRSRRWEPQPGQWHRAAMTERFTHERVLPMNLKKQLACIYTNNFFSGLRITDAVWVALLATRGFSLWEIGVAESVFHMVSLTFEVLTGTAALYKTR